MKNNLFHLKKSLKLSAVLVPALLFSAQGFAQSSINTFSNWDGSSGLNSWGAQSTQTYGQLITPTIQQTNLQSFTFSLQGASQDQFQAYVYKWDAANNRATGSPIFTSPVLSAPNSPSAYSPVSIQTGGTRLTNGQQYVLLFTTSGIPQVGGAYTWAATRFADIPTYAGGKFVWYNNASLSQLNTTTWDGPWIDGEMAFLALFGPSVSVADTQQSLVNTASALKNIYTLQNTVLANSLNYDCTEFGVNNVCVSAGGRNTAVSAANGLNNTSGLLIAAYRPHPNYRIGAYADQNLSVNNAGSTVNLGNNTPLIGLFGAWSERLDGTGTEVKVSAAYGQKNATITRQVVGTSEPGTGSSTLKSDGAQLTAKYGFKVAENTIVAPYVGIRYTLNNMPGYTEATSSSVTAPLTYYALNTNATTALAGVGASYKVIPQLTTFASAGVESDTNTTNGTYTAFGVTGLTPINFNPNLVKTRPTATLGAYYDVAKNQRLGLTGIYRQEAYQAVQTTTVMATYTVGL